MPSHVPSQTAGGRIHVLPPAVSQKIAAGEVIERPQALVRELLDNAIDAGATLIDLFIEDGGNALVTVQDNGCGMNRADLELCWLPHSTSKIATIDDLYNIRTLGFRGEALSSMASVSLLSIASSDGQQGGKLSIEGGKAAAVLPWSGPQGTRIEVRNLFYNLPARKQFLKRSATEGQLCRQTLVEKALSHPHVGFRFYKDGKQELFLPPRSENPFLDRYLDLNQDIPRPGLTETRHETPDFSFLLLAARPEIYRNDRKQVLVYLNQRRIQEFGLMQAIEHAYEGLLPGGRHPVATLYLQVAPHLVDVNIHPAKKEVKLLNFGVIHSAIVQQLSTSLRFAAAHDRKSPGIQASALADRAQNLDFLIQPPPRPTAFQPQSQATAWQTQPRQADPVAYRPPQGGEGQAREPPPATAVPGPARTEALDPSGPVSRPAASDFSYLGQIFGVFLLFTHQDSLWLMDMHAAHERLLYDRFRCEVKIQNLLLPRILELENDELTLLEAASQAARQVGFRWEIKDGTARISAIPAIPSCTYEGILESLKVVMKHPASLEKDFFADLACKAAIKDGEVLDGATARTLIAQALGLPDPHCPHGRPVFIALSRDQLWELIGRKV